MGEDTTDSAEIPESARRLLAEMRAVQGLVEDLRLMTFLRQMAAAGVPGRTIVEQALYYASLPVSDVAVSALWLELRRAGVSLGQPGVPLE